MHSSLPSSFRRFLGSMAAGCLAFSAGLSTASAQAIVHPAPIRGTVSLSNTNPAVLSLLNAPGAEGMTNLIVYAASLPPSAGIAANTGSPFIPVSTYLTAPYSVTVDAEDPGIAYLVNADSVMLGGAETYYFAGQTSAPVTLNQPPPTLDISECVGVVTLHFVDSLGASLSVDGGLISATTLDGFNSAVVTLPVGGASSQRLYLAGGKTHKLTITAQQGTDFASNLVQYSWTTNAAVVCDGFTDVSLVFPANGAFATVKGVFDVAGEFELTVPGYAPENLPGFSTVVADSGPFANQRWATFSGADGVAPSSGPFVLENVVPTADDPLNPGYQVFAQAVFRTNRQVNLFRTPYLGSGQNPPLTLSAGQAYDLGTTFSIHPGYLRGKVLLQGPPEIPGDLSQLRGILHPGDDVDTNGVPRLLGIYGVYWTQIEAIGVDTAAPGARYTASGGLGETDFSGGYDPSLGAVAGSYEMALGGLNGESALWNRSSLGLTFSSTVNTNDPAFYASVLSIAELSPPAIQVDPGQAATNDVSYCFSEVKVVFRDPTGSFYSPNLTTTQNGSFTGTDFQGRPANYAVAISYAYGTPSDPSTATNVGQVTAFLPQGAYTLNPSVTPAGTVGTTGLEPITLTVGCGQRLLLETCLQISLDVPTCANTNQLALSGSVRSCGNAVASITYSLNGGANQVACSNCGADPQFSFNLDLTGVAECSTNSLTVTATDVFGGVSSVTTSLTFDDIPPVIACPADIVMPATGTNGATVTFAATATDNCDGGVALMYNPPSGSVFPVGTNGVVCTAIDACGNRSSCSFNVIVTSGGATNCTLTIQPAVVVTWPCSGVLQSSSSISGPWTDIPGASNPYYAPVGVAPVFYRVRD